MGVPVKGLLLIVTMREGCWELLKQWHTNTTGLAAVQ